MMSLDCDPVRLDVPYLFEDSGINRVGNRYVYTYCSNFQTAGNALRLSDGAIQYMTADDPLGPYTYAGELFPNPGRFYGLGGNNHHSLACLDGEWYLFFHSRVVEKAMGISGNYRSPMAERVSLTADGGFLPVRGTMKGVEQLRSLDPFKTVPAATMSRQAGITVETDAGESRIRAEAGSWIQVSGVDFASSASALCVTALPGSDCTLYAVPDDPAGPAASEIRIQIPEDGEASVIRAPLSLQGVHDLYLVSDGDLVLQSWIVE
jgi:hypothetical protein